MTRVAIVGAGPAGIAAAGVLAAHGVAASPDRRRPPSRADRSIGSRGRACRSTSRRCSAPRRRTTGASMRPSTRLRDRIDYRPQTLAWAHRRSHAAYDPARHAAATVDFDALILATGATDRMLPVAGWTLPGVFTLGGAQVLLKEHGCLIGRRDRVLRQLAAALSRRQAVSRRWAPRSSPCSTPRRSPPRLRPQQISRPRPARSRAASATWLALRRAGVPMHHGVSYAPSRARPASRRCAFATAHGNEITLACDAVALGFGLKPETQLAELAGAALDYDRRSSANGCRAPTRTAAAAAASIVAGDGATVGGAQAAALTGTLAACAALEDLKIAVAGIDRARVAAAASRACAGSSAASRAPSRGRWTPSTGSMTTSWSAAARASRPASCARRSARSFGPTEVNRLKAITRCGMGRCQGRFCGLAAAELTAQTLGVPLEAVGRLRAQPPVKPIRSPSRRLNPAENAAAAARDGTSAPA